MLIAVSVYVFVLSVIFSIKTKTLINEITFIFLGLYFNLFLYELNWSLLIDTSNSFLFNYIFIMLALLLTVYVILICCVNKNKQEKKYKIYVKPFARQIFLILNVLYIMLYLVENYMGTGYFIPSLHHINDHTYTAPIISYYTSFPICVLAFDLYFFIGTKKKIPLFFIFLILLIPVFTRYSRMSIATSILELSCILFAYVRINLNKKIRKKIYRLIILLLIVSFLGFSSFTNYRMSIDGADYTYADSIKYTGPTWLEWFSPYYGYLPLSLNNLKINILYTEVNHNYVGLASYTCFYFGLFQLDNLLNLNPFFAENNLLVTSGAATVPTGLWNYYYDYGILFFIPIIFAFMITYYLHIRSNKNLGFNTLYYIIICQWFFTCFQNVLFSSTMIVSCIMTYLIANHSFSYLPLNEISDKNSIKRISTKCKCNIIC